MRVAEPIHLFKFCEETIVKVYGEQNLLSVAKIHNAIKDAYLKVISSRNKEPIAEALKHALKN